jgi:hypothetical protein
MYKTFSLDTVARRGLLMLVAAGAILPCMAGRAMAQEANSVVLFPAVVSSDGSSAKLAREIVTDAVKRFLTKSGAGVTVYNKRMPSIVRALNENEKMFTEKDIEAGPGDDNRKSQRYAEVIGANEYVTVFVDDYKFDAATRVAKFNLSVSRYNTATGSALGTYAKMQQGLAPADVAKPNQEGSAAARGAEVGSEEAIRALFPQPAAAMSAPMKKKKAGGDKGVLSIFGAAIGVLFLSTR